MQKIKQLYQNLSRGQRITGIIICALFIIAIIYWISISIYRINKVPVVVKFAPYSATITLNDTRVTNNTTIWLEPGSYRVKVTFDHFNTTEKTINISTDYKYIVGILNASDEQGNEYKNNHNQEFIDTEGVVGIALSIEGNNIKQKYPILNYLPINNRLYSISYAYTDDNEPVVTVKTSPKYLDVAIQKMKVLKNVDLINYQINFTPENPFAIYSNNPNLSPVDTIKQSFENIKSYKISDGQYISDNYYAATIYIYDYASDYSYAHYRVLLKKDENNYWNIVNSPQPLLTKQNTPNIPDDILNSANSIAP